MTAVTVLPQSRPLTRADLETTPDDGHRYELLDGVLLVSPAPRTGHQVVLGGLYVLLRAACPADLQVLFAPVDVVLAEDTVLQPDLLKRDRLQSAGVPSYWLVDPDEPSVTVLELLDGAYVEAGRAVADEALEVALPFPVRLVPAALAEG